MSKPTVTSNNGSIRLDWEDYSLSAIVTRIRQHKDGRTTGEVKMETTAPGVAPLLLNPTQLNFTAARSRKELITILQGKYPSVNWDSVIEQLCHNVLEQSRTGEPVVEIVSTKQYPPPRYLLYPLLPEGVPTIIFGAGGTTKSLLGTTFAACVSLPWQNNPLGLRTLEEPIRVLYLDWETDEEEIGWRLSCLAKGMGLPVFTLHYRRCALPLADDIEDIQKEIERLGIGLIIVDSVAAACGGELKDSNPALRMYEAIRTLKVTSLLITHTTKPGPEGSKNATPYGTVYFENYARSQWEVKKVQEVGSDSVEIGLFHKKVNRSKLFQPLGFHVTFGEDSISVKSKALAEIDELAAHLPLSTRIIGLLRRRGALTTKTIAEELTAEAGSVRKALERLSDKGETKRYGDSWGLLSKQPDPF